MDNSRRSEIARLLDRDGVVAALLFGSQATGRTKPSSDIDIAVWLDPGLQADARLDMRLRLSAALGNGDVDLVVLNDASPLLIQRARQSGLLMLDRDPRARVRLETKALIDYLDTKALRDELARGTLN